MWCRLIQWMIDWRTDSDKPLGTFLTSHLERCAACRGHLDAVGALAERLRDQARRGPMVPRLKMKVLASIASNRKPRPVVIPFPWTAVAIGIAASVLLAVAVILALTGRQPAGPGKVVITPPGPQRNTPPRKALASNPGMGLMGIPSLLPGMQMVDDVEAMARAEARRQVDHLVKDATAAGQTILASITVDLGRSYRWSPPK